MEDEKLKLLELIMSGSLQKKKTEITEVDNTNITQDALLEMLMNTEWMEDELKNSATPYYTLSKEDSHYWLLNMSIKTLMKIPAGTEVIPVDSDSNDKTLCMIGHSLYLIPNNIISCIGWN